MTLMRTNAATDESFPSAEQTAFEGRGRGGGIEESFPYSDRNPQATS